MAKHAKSRRKFSDAIKRTTVRRIRNGSTITAEATRLDCSRGLIDNWVKDPRYQSSDELRPDALPTKPRSGKPRRAKARPPVPTGYKCPHCGGLLEVAA